MLESSINFEEQKITTKSLDTQNLKYYNEYGGFSEDGKEYIIKVNRENRLPTVWSNILANENFGALVTESGLCYTWSKNSRLNRISAWSNNQVVDVPSEIIYMQNKETLKTCSITLNPMPDDNDYFVTHGLGYTIYNHISSGIEQKLTVFVPKEGKIKLNILELKNLEAKKKNLRLFYYIKPVLGEDETISNGYINVKYDGNSNIIYAKNLSNSDFKEILYLSSSEKIKSFTKSRSFFMEKGNLSNPEGLKKVNLDNNQGIDENSLIVYEIDVELEAFETKQISFIVGSEEKLIDCQIEAYKYAKIQNCTDKLEEVKKYWKDLTGKIQIKTPVESFNIMINGWLLYQTIACRLWARTGFYQSGGAFRL